MEKTKTMKFTGIIVSVVMAFALVFLLAGCNSEISLKDASKSFVVAANNYHQTHEGYPNFADSTFTFAVNTNATEKVELTYKESATATEEKTATFTNTTNVKTDATISVKNVTRGEGDSAVKDVFLKFDFVKVEKSTMYSVKDGLLKTTNVNATTNETYIMGSKVEDDNVAYYITHYANTQMEGEDAVETKEYYDYSDRDSYIAAGTREVLALNKIIDGGFFGVFKNAEDNLAMLSFAKFSKNGNNITMNVNITAPTINEYNALITTSEASATVSNTQIVDFTTKLVIESPDFGSMDNQMKVSFAPTAGDIAIGDLTGYTEASGEIYPEHPSFFEGE